MASLLYVSTSLLDEEAQDRELDAIVKCAHSRNADLGITGALVFTGEKFAQALEGPQQAVAELMDSIIKDQRHRDVETVPIPQISGRRFDDWSLAYAGPSLFVAREVDRVLSEADGPARASKLLRLMQAFTSEARLAG
jgi:hypothetical protein